MLRDEAMRDPPPGTLGGICRLLKTRATTDQSLDHLVSLLRQRQAAHACKEYLSALQNHSDPKCDLTWLEAADEAEAREKSELENRVRQAKASQMREQKQVAHQRYGTWLLMRCRFEEALAELERARDCALPDSDYAAGLAFACIIAAFLIRDYRKALLFVNSAPRASDAQLRSEMAIAKAICLSAAKQCREAADLFKSQDQWMLEKYNSTDEVLESPSCAANSSEAHSSPSSVPATSMSSMRTEIPASPVSVLGLSDMMSIRQIASLSLICCFANLDNRSLLSMLSKNRLHELWRLHNRTRPFVQSFVQCRFARCTQVLIDLKESETACQNFELCWEHCRSSLARMLVTLQMLPFQSIAIESVSSNTAVPIDIVAHLLMSTAMVHTAPRSNKSICQVCGRDGSTPRLRCPGRYGTEHESARTILSGLRGRAASKKSLLAAKEYLLRRELLCILHRTAAKVSCLGTSAERYVLPR